MEGLGWEWFVRKVVQKSGIDLRAYKRPQMERRINSFMRTVGADSYADLIKLCEDNPEVYRRFVEHLTINVSEFFRNANHWDVLRYQIIPELLKEKSPLKIWSAGCSTGEEPYSLAIMMQEYFPGQANRIWATDLDQVVLNKAKQGVYSEKAVQGVPPHLIKKYFVQDSGSYRIADSIKAMVRFEKHDLLADKFPGDFDLILCRNVVIYFTEEAKDKLYRKFAQALRRNGVLFIGSTEQIFQARELDLKSIATFFYQKGG
ncbi:MAG: CheR family methyltransferase [Bacillota bacterium]